MNLEIVPIKEACSRWSIFSKALDDEMKAIANVRPSDFSLASIHDGLSEANCLILFATDGLQDIGMLVYEEHKTHIVIVKELYVKEEYRSQGVGSLMLSCIKAKAKDREVCLRVVGGNERALRFYQRSGFQIESYSMRSVPSGSI